MALEITIDQTEIETAIKNHIGTLLTINDGQEVTIDLKAGRGENGFSASVKIGAVSPTVAPSTDTGSEKPVVTGPFKRQAKPQAAVAETAQTTAQAAPEGDSTTATAETTSDAGEQQAGAQDAQQGEGEAAPAAKGGLFAHLGKRTGTETPAE